MCLQRLAKLVVQLAHNIIVDAKRALWWQERTARARAEAAARKRLAEQQRLQAQSRCAATGARRNYVLILLLKLCSTHCWVFGHVCFACCVLWSVADLANKAQTSHILLSSWSCMLCMYCKYALGCCRDEEHFKQQQRVVRDDQFSRVLQTMGDPLIPLEDKWPAIAQQCSRKEEFRWACSHLYN